LVEAQQSLSGQFFASQLFTLTVYALWLHTHNIINTYYIQTYNVTCTTGRFNATENLMEPEMFVIALLELVGV